MHPLNSQQLAAERIRQLHDEAAASQRAREARRARRARANHAVIGSRRSPTSAVISQATSFADLQQ
jgi:hypothetical protein